MKAYFPERVSPARRRWTGKELREKSVVYAVRRRTKNTRGKLLSPTRSELVERSFAHVCDTGGAKRTWIRRLLSVNKQHPMAAAVGNLSTIMRVIWGIGSPGALEGLRALLQPDWNHFRRLVSVLENLLGRAVQSGNPASRSTVAARSFLKRHHKRLCPRPARAPRTRITSTRPRKSARNHPRNFSAGRPLNTLTVGVRPDVFRPGRAGPYPALGLCGPRCHGEASESHSYRKRGLPCSGRRVSVRSSPSSCASSSLKRLGPPIDSRRIRRRSSPRRMSTAMACSRSTSSRPA
jgi:hypothetical protein